MIIGFVEVIHMVKKFKRPYAVKASSSFLFFFFSFFSLSVSCLHVNRI